MSAAYLDFDGLPESTLVDVPVPGRRIQGRLTSLTRAEAESVDDSPAINLPPVSDVAQPLAAPKAARLSELYVRSVEDRRRSGAPISTAATTPGRPSLVFARVDDPGLRLRKRPDGFELSGQASHVRGRTERRLSIAFDGELFAVLIQPSESPGEILKRLRDRLFGRYEVSIEPTGPSGFLVTFCERLSIAV